MSVTTIASIASLTVDPAQWSVPLVDTRYEFRQYTSGYLLSRADREVSATVSAIVGDSRPVVTRHNNDGRWAVKIDESTSSRIELVWSSFTPNENPTCPYGSDVMRPILRGEAVMVMIHEIGHVLFTTEITRPSWCDPAYWKEFFSVVNFAEDVRIEDALENVVPVFPMLRRVENDRIVGPNVTSWPTVGMVRKVSMYLFAKRSCTNGDEFDAVVNQTERDVIDASHDAFMAACDSPDTGSLVEALRPMYDALLPYMDGTIQYPPPTQGGESGEDEDAEGEDEDREDYTPGGESEATDEGEDGDGESGDEDEDGEDTGGDASGGGDEQGEDESDEDSGGSGGEGGEDGPSNSRDNEDGSDPGNDANGGEANDYPDTLRPDRERGKWDEDRDETPLGKPERSDEVIHGDFITTRRVTNQYWAKDDNASTRLAPTTRLVVKNLRRVLQDNANGGWIGRKRRGAFDPQSSKRLALGDLRTFRNRVGPKGSLDYSLVLCIDASGSVAGNVGLSIADSALSIYDSANKIDGLDVALCAYGCTVDFGIPFSSTLTKQEIRKVPNALMRALRCIRTGASGGTNESDAIVWARAASRKRNADRQMIVVLTDGTPNDEREVRTQVAEALYEGVVTGGIGVGYPAPEYHTYSTSIMDVPQLPNALGAFIRTMMKEAK